MNTPWGKWVVLLEEPDFKVKRITVNAGHRLSYQVHSKRKEHWVIVRGLARITLNGEVMDIEAGKNIDIPFRTPHRVENPGREPLEFIEVQMGTYFGEDDNVRLEDDYGRASKTS
jgi:mannose-6-phosphate isomerase-like protein (cupin superfamily)